MTFCPRVRCPDPLPCWKATRTSASCTGGRSGSARAEESTQALRSWSLWRGGNWYAKRARDLRNVILSPEVVMRRKLVDELGYYDHGLPHSSDMYLWLRASRVADVGRVNGPIQAHYRVHGNNMHLTDFGGAVADLRERARTWRRLADGAPVGARTHVEAQRAASRGIAREAVTTATAIAQVDGAEVESVRELRRMAKEAWPAIAESRRWRRLHAIGTAGASAKTFDIARSGPAPAQSAVAAMAPLWCLINKLA